MVLLRGVGVPRVTPGKIGVLNIGGGLARPVLLRDIGVPRSTSGDVEVLNTRVSRVSSGEMGKLNICIGLDMLAMLWGVG